MTARRGVTMIELLVALTVLALLAALIVPAVQRAREASRRAQCQSHLANVGRALEAYEAIHGKFPPAQPATQTSPTTYSDRYFSPQVLLLPYLEQSPLFQTIELNVQQPYWDWGDASPVDPQVQARASTTIAIFVCPSDHGTSGNNYRFCLGPGPVAVEDMIEKGGGVGPFVPLRPLGARDFVDGLSNTIGMSEKRKSRQHPQSFGEEDFWYTGIFDLLGVVPSADEMAGICNSLTGPPPRFHAHAGATWYLSSFAYTWYNHAVPPNARIPDCCINSGTAAGTPPGEGVYKASSHHPGGVHCLVMDGSVKFVSDHIDLAVWRALSTRSDGEIVSSQAF